MFWIPRRPLRRNPALREGLAGAVLLLFVAAVTYWLTTEFYLPAWESRGLVAVVAIGLGQTFDPWIPGETYLFLYVLPVGFLLGTAVVWFLDDFKRYQAVILWTVIVIGFLALWQRGKFVPALLANLTFVNLFFLLSAVVVGVRTAGVPLEAVRRRGSNLLGDTPREFSRAPRLVLASFALVVAVGFVDFHFLDPSGSSLLRDGVRRQQMVLPHLFFAVLLLYAFWKFTEYESEIRTVQIGPARAGKTAVFSGLYAYLENSDEYTIDESEAEFDLSYLDAVKNGEFPDRNKAAQGSGPTTQWLEIPFVSNRWLFRKRIVISTLDYPGELVGRKGPGLDEKVQEYENSDESTDDEQTLVADAKRLVAGAEGRDNPERRAEQLVEALARLVHAADTVLVTIPLDDFVQEVAADDAVPPYIEAYWLKESTDDSDRQLYRLDGSVAEKEYTYTGEVEPLPTYEHDELGEVRLLLPNESGRTSNEEYRDVYESLVRRYADDGKEFVWTVTKADYASKQFVDACDKATGTNRDDRGRDPVKDVQAHKIPEAEKAQKLFARWVESRLVESQDNWRQFSQQMRETTNESFVYPLWYNITDDSPPSGDTEPSIDTNYPTILRGAEYLVDRIQDKPFVDQQTPASFLPGKDAKRRTDHVLKEIQRSGRKSTNDERTSQTTEQSGQTAARPDGSSEKHDRTTPDPRRDGHGGSKTANDQDSKTAAQGVKRDGRDTRDGDDDRADSQQEREPDGGPSADTDHTRTDDADSGSGEDSRQRPDGDR
jgi:hypothetical protein